MNTTTFTIHTGHDKAIIDITAQAASFIEGIG